jgi:hypothetical protein
MHPSQLPGVPGAKFKTVAVLMTWLVVLLMILTACGGANAASNKAILKVATQSYDFAQSGFNPYNSHPNAGLQGLIYETLYFVNVK